MAQPRDDYFSSPELARERAREALSPKRPVDSGLERPTPFKKLGRYLLPSIALALAIVSFSWPLLTETDVSFTLSQEQVTTSDGRVMMQNLRYMGVDKQDQLFIVNARQGEQEDPQAKRVSLTDVQAQIDLQDQRDLFLEAKSGLYRIEEEELSLTGDVRLESASGTTLEMAGAEVKLAEKTAIGQGQVRGKAALGQLSADSMSIDLNNSTGVFAGRVLLKITPKRTDKAPNKPSDG